MFYATPDEPDAKYGPLSRDGVACARVIARERIGNAESFTEGSNSILLTYDGPYEDLITAPRSMR